MTTNSPTKHSEINPVVLQYRDYYERILPTGSRVICQPPPEGSDVDFLILVSPDKLQKLRSKLEEDGWYLGGSATGDLEVTHKWNDETNSLDMTNVFMSYKRAAQPGFPNGSAEDILVEWISDKGPELNIIITLNKTYFEDFTRATFLARALNLRNKNDRVVLFEALCRDKWPDADYERLSESARITLSNDYVLTNGSGNWFVHTTGSFTDPVSLATETALLNTAINNPVSD